MYKFTNGIVVFDEKTRDEYLKTGYKLVKEIEHEVVNEDSDEKTVEQIEELNGNETNNDRIIEEEHTRSNTKTAKSRK